MEVHQELREGRLVLAPDRALLCAGPAEQFEALLQNVLADGHRHLVVDLTHVPHMDSGGVRALVRGYLTAQRLGGTLSLAGMDRRVMRILTLMRLDLVFPIFATVDDAVKTEVAGTG
jgi:anti-anti-sigma factor